MADLASPDRPGDDMRFLLIAATTLILTLAPGIRAWSSSEEDPWMQGTVAWSSPIKKTRTRRGIDNFIGALIAHNTSRPAFPIEGVV
ncbi:MULTISPECIES: hypothetical protein [Prochlorococcus]|uniref:hypothetical protein n=1 Tax=Prochlorococcus TaxID=1218 RepID=UPI001F4097AA|nr:hypothetical protein [Prochlorococcus marinus]